ncbi:Alkyl hydroperoxide reductase and/or thiol-specific antioxidant family (AhpC/TSA) protein [hydrothermal vent metagenome]|uniref:Alkyl hydroperoxide reductase and/or thiol-specific antioxidant family (AhpC/TSA) protein n=1 Tax=hydrothermal vent metagenome TaxID=652676 RepID=A0A3B0W0P1_9ZZZZ
MSLLYTPKLKSGKKMPDFNLPGVDGKTWSLNNCMGKNGLVVMFICNHCPYVKSIQHKLVADALVMQKFAVNVVAIMSNDVNAYPEDSFENMQQTARNMQYPFPYLLDSTQETAKAYGAVCTPDIFGLDKNAYLQYRGRLDAAGMNQSEPDLPRDLVNAMQQLALEGKITTEQIASMGCSIKWINPNQSIK